MFLCSKEKDKDYHSKQKYVYHPFISPSFKGQENSQTEQLKATHQINYERTQNLYRDTLQLLLTYQCKALLIFYWNSRKENSCHLTGIDSVFMFYVHTVPKIIETECCAGWKDLQKSSNPTHCSKLRSTCLSNPVKLLTPSRMEI